MPEARALHKVRFPKFDANVEEGTVGRWLVAEGDEVRVGARLVELVTDKANFEFENEFAGTVLRILAPEKSTVPVGYVLAVVGEPGEEVPDGVEAENEALIAAHSQKLLGLTEGGGEAEPEPPAARKRKSLRVRATPRARKLARERGVDLEALAAKLGGRPVTEADVEEAMGK
jgi:pyruvate dehydrogenase E2 component (dihydrolipoamide acetyltransferase)